MKQQIASESGWRGSPEVWLDAAFELLIESGVESVKIATLAKRLSLSRTSFYWFFSDREALLDALVARWRDKNTGNLVRQCEAYADSAAEAVLNVFDCWIDKAVFDQKLEFAMRSWSLQSAEILAEAQLADQQRLTAITQMFERFNYPAVSADVHARTIYLVQIGYVSMQTDEALEVRMKRIAEYVKIFTGTAPEQKELARFFSRHGYQPVAI